MTGLLVPSLLAVRDAMAVSRELNRRNLLANYAVRILEEQVGVTATNWVNETVVGNFAADGYANVRYACTKSDDPVDGGIVNQLMSVDVTVFDDVNGNSTLDADELNESFGTKIAKMNTYENEPQ